MVVDVTRVASYVAAAVGFIGAGVIVKGRHGVRGLTTATSLWATCAIGLAAGVGLLAIASVVAAGVLVTLLLDYPMTALRRRLVGAQRALVLTALPDSSTDDVADVVRSLVALDDVEVVLRSDDERTVIVVTESSGRRGGLDEAHAVAARYRLESHWQDGHRPVGP